MPINWDAVEPCEKCGSKQWKVNLADEYECRRCGHIYEDNDSDYEEE